MHCIEHSILENSDEIFNTVSRTSVCSILDGVTVASKA